MSGQSCAFYGCIPDRCTLVGGCVLERFEPPAKATEPRRKQATRKAKPKGATVKEKA